MRAIAVLKDMAHDEPLNIQEGLKSKLRIIAMTTADSDLRESAEEALQAL
jgi:hypothetical protein